MGSSNSSHGPPCVLTLVFTSPLPYNYIFPPELKYKSLSVPIDSPLRNVHSFFWGFRLNDEGVGRRDGLHALMNADRITLVAPARAAAFASGGRSVRLRDGRDIRVDVVILAMGYTSSWDALFDMETREDLGLTRQLPSKSDSAASCQWDYASLSHPPLAHPDAQQWTSSIYRGLVPAKNILKRDFAINGAFTANNGYTYEIAAHWISTYFLGDAFLRLPPSAEAALAHTQRTAAWLRTRFPETLAWANESYSSGVAFFTWPQAMDELLEDMGLRTMRSGGNWLNWAFKSIDLKEIEGLGEERAVKRSQRLRPGVV